MTRHAFAHAWNIERRDGLRLANPYIMPHVWSERSALTFFSREAAEAACREWYPGGWEFGIRVVRA